ncbi:zinc-binding dehydrogenase [Agrococcus sediminis]|uniref:zinc-dependent alcohol dehydrogenase n=1 Tax=Agrococcus sediminis TaxID=2599924 RepID=UPI00382041EE
MEATVLEHAAAGAVVRRRVPLPHLDSQSVLCEPLAVGLCHTDVSVIRGLPGVQAGYAPRFPLVLGHEFVAEVREVGGEVSGITQGDRVVASSHISCRACRWCDSGRSELCRDKRVIGLDIDGALAERIVMPAEFLRTIPADLPLELAVLAEPFAVALHAVELGGLAEGERVAVIGAGAVGLLSVCALVAAGHAPTLIGLPADARQLELGLELGAGAATLVDDALAESSGDFDVVVEAAGHHSAVAASLALVGPGGRVICVGLPAESTTVDTAELARQEKALIGSRAYDLSTWDSVPRLLAANPAMQRMVTHTLAMDDIDRAIDLIERRAATKVMLVPTTELSSTRKNLLNDERQRTE